MSDTLNTLPNGWAYVDVSQTRKDDDGQTIGRFYTASEDGNELFSIEGPVWVAVPVEAEALNEAIDSYSTTVETEDGELKLSGSVALGVRKYLHFAEQARGYLRSKAAAGRYNEESAREYLRTWRYGVRRSRKPASVSGDALTEIASIQDPTERAEALARLLTQSGVAVTN